MRRSKVLGVMADISPMIDEKSIQLSPGDKILLYMDGVTEAYSQENERFSLDRLSDSLKKHGRGPWTSLST